MTMISKSFTFCASHQLDGMPPGHRCARVHGHNYTVTIKLRGTADKTGMVLDYGKLDPFRRQLDEVLDHRHLGYGDLYDADGTLTAPAVLDVNPTAENLASWLYGVAEGMYGHLVMAIEVKETDGTAAEVSR